MTSIKDFKLQPQTPVPSDIEVRVVLLLPIYRSVPLALCMCMPVFVLP